MVLPVCSSVLTAISLQFNLKGKNDKIILELIKFQNIKNTLDYVLSTNGNLTEAKCDEIVHKFT